MSEEDLRVLLSSPALSLEPPRALADDVRRKARQHRLRTRIGGGVGAVVIVTVGVLVAPAIRGSIDDLRSNSTTASDSKPDPRAPHATSEVVTMRVVNRAELLTWFEGRQWCTRSTRLTQQSTCFGPVDPAHTGFSWVVPARTPSVTVDDQYYVAGIAPPGAARIVVQMSDGREFEADIVDGRNFPAPVWSTQVNLSYGSVARYVAYDSSGVDIAHKPAP
jgi:hypothetical protein